MPIEQKILEYKAKLERAGAQLIAVSKTQAIDAIQEAYNAGQRAFGENMVQEMVEKQALLPQDIQWHLIGHLQSNKVKYIAPFVHLIHSVDSLKLLIEINKQALKNKRVIDCLLQVHIADEDTKFGLDFDEVVLLLTDEAFQSLDHVRIVGLMGIATNTENQNQISEEFRELKIFFKGLKESFFSEKAYFTELSMGMSSDFNLALEQGSTMVRIGSDIFGHRPKK